MRLLRTAIISGLALFLAAGPIGAADYHGPWKIADLQKPPKVEWVDAAGSVRQLYYSGEPYRGKPTRVYAWYAQPENLTGKRPAIVLVHGGGGTAFKEWAELWAKRGYVALAMDLAGCGPNRKRLEDGGPEQGDAAKFPRERTALTDMWSYHAVASVIRGVSLLQSLPNLDGDKIAITGISWGGYLTCIVAGLDDRLKAAVPVYGCGFLYHNSVWVPAFEKLPSELRKEWVQNFDPSKYVGQAKMPMLFVNGTNDFAYPLDSYQKTYRTVKNRALCVTVNMPHGHQQGWAPTEIGLFVDQHLIGGKPLAILDRATELRVEQGKRLAVLPVWNTQGIERVQLHWTKDVALPWQKRKWETAQAAATVGNATDFYQAELPATGPLVWFFTATDSRKATVSSEHQILDK
jgi:dienelactone hydrolase